MVTTYTSAPTDLGTKNISSTAVSFPSSTHRVTLNSKTCTPIRFTTGISHTVGWLAGSSRLARPLVSTILPDKLQNVFQSGFVDYELVTVAHHGVRAFQCNVVIMSGKSNARCRGDHDSDDCDRQRNQHKTHPVGKTPRGTFSFPTAAASACSGPPAVSQSTRRRLCGPGPASA